MSLTHFRYFRVPDTVAGRLGGAVQACVQRLFGATDGVTVELRLRDNESLRKSRFEDLDALARLENGFALAVAARADANQQWRLDVCGGRLRATVTGWHDERGGPALRDLAEELRLEDARCLALSLSGGGFRATLFHLGVVRYLADIGKLQDVTHICSVSGGSILAAHLVQNWARYVEGDFDAAAAEVLRIVRCDLRNRVFRRWLMSVAFLPVRRFLGGADRWCRTTLLRREYDRLYRSDVLQALDNREDPPSEKPRPDLYLMSTAMKTGDMCSFTGRGMRMESGRLRAGEGAAEQLIGGALLPISLAVAASSAFPPAFPPVRVTHGLLLVDPSRFPQSPEYLSDGGVYDNLGIRKMQHLQVTTRLGIAALVVSDAEAPFMWQVGSDFRAFWRRAARSSDILMKRVADLEYAYASRQAGVATAPLLRCSISEVPTGAEALPQELVYATRQIRTDLDRFSELEISCLVRHGYLVAQKIIGGSELVLPEAEQQRRRDHPLRPWHPQAAPGGGPAAHGPPPMTRAATVVREQVAQLEKTQRSKRRWLAAVFDRRDWVTWLTLLALLGYLAPLAALIAIPTWRAEGWRSEFLAHWETFRETWNFQVVYPTAAEVDEKLDPQVRQWAARPKSERAGWTKDQREAVESYERLRSVAGEASDVFTAYVSQHDILGDSQNQLFAGYVRNFRFPRSTASLLMEFRGRLPVQDRRCLELEFYQYRLLETGDDRRVTTYQVVFQATGTDAFEGSIPHPVLKDTNGRPLNSASMRLWLPAPE